MERKRQVRMPDGEYVSATEVGFRTSGEYWNEYLLDDGTVVRIKPVGTEFLRIEERYDDSGNPVYMVNTQNVIHVSAPEERRRFQ